jgi:hypothetical protein
MQANLLVAIWALDVSIKKNEKNLLGKKQINSFILNLIFILIPRHHIDLDQLHSFGSNPGLHVRKAHQASGCFIGNVPRTGRRQMEKCT